MNIFTTELPRVNYAWKQACAIFLLVIGMLFALPVLSFSQSQYEQEQKKELEKLFTDRAFDCNDVYKNCARLISQYYAKGMMDSVAIITKYWQSECPGAAALVRFQALWALQSDTVPLTVIPPRGFLHGIRYYKWYYEYGTEGQREYRDGESTEFDVLTDSLAANVIARTDSSTFENHIARLFSGKPNSVFRLLQDEPGNESPVGQAYKAFSDSVRYSGEEYWGVGSGAWVPFGKRDVLGVKPMISFLMGYKKSKFLIELYMGIAFGKSPELYLVKAGDSLLETDDFNCGFFAVESGYELYKSHHHEFDFMLGVGAQVVNSIYKDDEKYEDGKQFWSAAGSIGVRYRLYPAKYNSTFIYIQPMLELARINTEGGTDLSGAAVTLRIGLAFRSVNRSEEKQPALRELEYNY